MKRLILIMQYPTPMRYQSWWWEMLPVELSRYFTEVIILGKEYIESKKLQKQNKGLFAPIEEAVLLEIIQVKEYLKLELMENDVLFLTDLSFPGIFSSVLFLKKASKMFAFCHATAKNRYDLFLKDRKAKYGVEKSISLLFDKIFVGSYYHKNKLGWGDILEVLYLPFFPYKFDIQPKLKLYDFVSVARKTRQKRNMKLENLLLKNVKFNLDDTEGIFKFWKDYFDFISNHNGMLITSNEETFGYQVMDAIANDCIPLAPRNFAYPELLDDKYLYSGYEELKEKVIAILEGKKIGRASCRERV